MNNSNLVKYVVGFALNKSKTKVLLIKKTKPSWQNGLLNGIGGKIESYDNKHVDAMVREFHEECNILTTANDWYKFAFLESDFFQLDCYVGFFDESIINNYKTMTEEEILLINISDLYSERFKLCISNLSWLIGLCLENDIKNINVCAKL